MLAPGTRIAYKQTGQVKVMAIKQGHLHGVTTTEIAQAVLHTSIHVGALAK